MSQEARAEIRNLMLPKIASVDTNLSYVFELLALSIFDTYSIYF